MKKIVKIVLVLVVMCGVLIAGAVVFTLNKLDSLAKIAVEEGTTYVLDVPTTLTKAHVQIAKQSLELEGLKIANPSGFKTDHFLTLADGGVSIDAAKLLKDKVADIPRLTLTSIDVNLEKSGGKANYQQILDNVNRFEKSGTTKPAKKSATSDLRYVVERLEIKDINAHAQLLPIGGSMTTVDVTVPQLILTDIGTAGKPVTMSELVNLITKAVMSSIISVGGGALPAEMLNDLQGSLASLSSLGANVGAQILDQSGKTIGDLQGSLGGLGDKVNDAAKSAADSADKALKDVQKNVKDLLGGGNPK